MEDKVITCKECCNEFIFTVGEQEFFEKRNFVNDPIRCPDCRKKRKKWRNDSDGNTNGS